MYLDLDAAVTADNDTPRENDNVVFTCGTTTTEADLTYEWYVDSVIIDDATADTYTLIGGNRSLTGKNYTCKVTARSNSLVKTSDEKSVEFLCKCY